MTPFWVLVLVAFACISNVTPHFISKPDEKIVGGNEIDIREAPFQAALFDGDEFHCGGVIISNRFILTAEHCLK